MANTASASFRVEVTQAPPRAKALGPTPQGSVASVGSPVSLAPVSLATVAPGEIAEVIALEIEADMAAWLEAVGIGAGESLIVLRRAVFGGPIHVRTRAGGEFAIARSLAEAVVIRRGSSASIPSSAR